jgi:ankyrin repeat protein
MSEFFEACARGDAETLRRLLSADASLARATDPRGQFGGWTGLHSAAKSGRVEAVRVLLQHGADPNAREAGDHTTPLHWAAACGQLDIAGALLDAGADPQGSGDAHELDVIGWAAVFGSPAHDPAPMSAERRELIARLVQRGARHHVFSAMAMGDLDLIRRVAEQDPKALERRQSRFEHQLTPLHFAIDRKRYDLLDLLIALGAGLEAQDGRGHTALTFAALRGDRDAVRRLHAAGAKFPGATEPGDARPAVAALGASVKKVVPMIYVPDVARALDWYTSIGFAELARYGANGLVNFGMVALGHAELMLNAHGKAGPQTASVWLYTDRVDAIYQVLKSRQLAAVRASLEGEPGPGEIAFEQDIEDMFYGARQFCIRDPHGYEIYFIQSMSE